MNDINVAQNIWEIFANKIATLLLTIMCTFWEHVISLNTIIVWKKYCLFFLCQENEKKCKTFLKSNKQTHSNNKIMGN